MFTPETPPAQSDYVNAINEIRESLSERSLKVLRFQFQQPGRSVTSQDLRDHFGYSSIGASNLLYGNLGKQFAVALRMQTEPEDSSRTRYWKALATGDGSGEHFIWIMRPELANALVQTSLVDPSRDGLIMVPDIDVHTSSFSAVEGRQKLVIHLVRERSRSIVSAKKASAESLACEICGFDSTAVYGEEYCEVHHLTPLTELKEDAETSLDDLAIVCANCHRIIHLYSPPLTLDQVREKINDGLS
ncbi:MAG TPA: hypothetical protein DIT97_10530 [Gimesia maris]|uniref:HNH nuclease domain-containing protein n=1 Tax=Gimesia maris TaxID=122 RepID=A0A3D3R5V5_9PLAN|nr:hypothetical protein [Gimesia maris]|tara:strand:+ start:9671 stop:10408 length:738 start_codon:yes stop_codon:yes gene_type:complete